jgi:hypothetical protein
VREFATGATRDSDEGKPDYEGFLHPAFIEAFGAYMHKHRVQADGKLRASDNWQKGIPSSAYMKSLWRHFLEVWKLYRQGGTEEAYLEAICACVFNLQGLLVNNLNYVKLKVDRGGCMADWGPGEEEAYLAKKEKAPSPEEKRPFGERLGTWVPGEAQARTAQRKQAMWLAAFHQQRGDHMQADFWRREVERLESPTESSREGRTSASDTASPGHQEYARPRWSRQLDRPAEPSPESRPLQDGAVAGLQGPTPPYLNSRPASELRPRLGWNLPEDDGA